MEDTKINSNKKRLVIGMSGASGAILGIEILEILREHSEWETHLVISKGSEETIAEETNYKLEDVMELADKAYSIKDIGASIASGTFKTEGMIIVPCSMKTVAGIACGYSDNLLLRAADVIIKEKRKLVLVARECPLSTIHLRNMLSLSELGVIIMPPMVSYYNKPVDINDLNNHIIGKILDRFGIEVSGFNRWGESDV
ncbi:UbiX family flavin prenyltransferase [Clostridium autoethanogenum]|uniref:Flavin prenyltransferase UbiX n=1 Tax=Clostridium autoethanogenum TaxID=84023 RepID=A0A3M0SEH6_9CLOT|nr:UbiX family flavin prenyltransferase [Clostridium autoethanogenum]RMC96655.1 UbiX family flavin prenyltransferase [Clostridium autoethanogenum]